jgi:hypothetical protein
LFHVKRLADLLGCVQTHSIARIAEFFGGDERSFGGPTMFLFPTGETTVTFGEPGMTPSTIQIEMIYLAIAIALAVLVGVVALLVWRRYRAALERLEIVEICYIVATAGLLVALFPMPYSYYMALRIVIFSAATLGAIRGRWSGVFWVVAALYNPFIPVHATRSIWAALNVAAALVFLASLITTLRADAGDAATARPEQQPDRRQPPASAEASGPSSLPPAT